MGKKKVGSLKGFDSKSSMKATTANTSDILSLFSAGEYLQIAVTYIGLRDNPTADVSQSFVLAGALFKLGRFHEAFEILRAISRDLVSNTQFHSLMGATCRRLGLLDQAKTHFEHGCKLDPNNPDIYNNFANLLIDTGELEHAEAMLIKAIELNPSHADARVNLERLSQSRGNRQPDLSFECTDLDPLAAAFDQQYISSTLKTSANTSKKIVKHPVDTDLLPSSSAQDMAVDQLKIVPSLIGKKQYDTALQLISSAHKMLKNINPEVYLNAADALVRRNSFKEAEILTLHGILAGGKTFGAYANLVNFALMRGDCKLAAYYFKEAAHNYPTEQRLESLREQIRQTHSRVGRDYSFASDW